MGAWVTYGIGSESKDLPGFVVLQSGPRGPRGGAVNWGSGFLPTSLPGRPVPLQRRPDRQPLHARRASPPQRQRDTIDAVSELNLKRLVETGDPEIATRISQYEMAYRMQTSAPELIDLSRRDRRRRSTCTAPSRASRRSPTTACSPAGSSSAACASSSSTTPTGTATAAPAKTSRSDFEKLCRRSRPGQRRAGQRPQAARPARRHARHLGRRVRPHADGREPRHHRPQPPHRRLHHVDRRRRHQAGHRPRRDRRARLRRRRRPRATSTTSTRRSCTCSASTTRS